MKVVSFSQRFLVACTNCLSSGKDDHVSVARVKRGEHGEIEECKLDKFFLGKAHSGADFVSIDDGIAVCADCGSAVTMTELDRRSFLSLYGQDLAPRPRAA